VTPESSSIIAMSGELDFLRRDEIRRLLRIPPAAGPVLIDLSEVTYADSTILAELLRFYGEAKERNVRVALVIASKQFARLVQYAGLGQAFKIFGTTEEARAYLAEGAST
jgi:anti-sigma B factor antagonist